MKILPAAPMVWLCFHSSMAKGMQPQKFSPPTVIGADFSGSRSVT